MDGRCSEEGDCGRGLRRRRRGRAVGRAVDAAGRTRTVNAYITLLRCSRDNPYVQRTSTLSLYVLSYSLIHARYMYGVWTQRIDRTRSHGQENLIR
jgi:hypothetical protein